MLSPEIRCTAFARWTRYTDYGRVNGILLDRNVISELTKDEPDERVIAFLSRHQELWVSCIVVHELEFGLRLLPPGRRREELQSVVSGFLTEYEDCILPVDRRAAEAAAELRVHAQRSRRALHLGDALIAGTAKAHDLAVATRNVTDFSGLDVNVTNPWEDADRSGEEAGADTAPPLPSVEDEGR